MVITFSAVINMSSFYILMGKWEKSHCNEKTCLRAFAQDPRLGNQLKQRRICPFIWTLNGVITSFSSSGCHLSALLLFLGSYWSIWDGNPPVSCLIVCNSFVCCKNIGIDVIWKDLSWSDPLFAKSLLLHKTTEQTNSLKIKCTNFVPFRRDLIIALWKTSHAEEYQQISQTFQSFFHQSFTLTQKGKKSKFNRFNQPNCCIFVLLFHYKVWACRLRRKRIFSGFVRATLNTPNYFIAAVCKLTLMCSCIWYKPLAEFLAQRQHLDSSLILSVLMFYSLV